MTNKATEILENLIEDYQGDESDFVNEYFGQGICYSCGNIQDECEPDASEYRCLDCGEYKVHGIETAILELL